MRAAACVALLLALGACSSEPASVPPTASASPPAPFTTYAAIGDSYTSGAGIAGSPTSGCRRAPGAYPALVAADLGVRLSDASCSGARTEHVTQPQPTDDGTANPPQLDAVAPGTDLVTVSLGFNDAGFLRNLVKPGRDRSRSITRVPAIGARVEAVVRQVQQRAPQARVLLVGYPQLAPPDRPCAPLPDEAYAAFAALATELDAVATRTGSTYVDVAAASAGHDVCAGPDAWVNGGRPQPGVAAPYHPFASEQAAVAQLVLAAVS